MIRVREKIMAIKNERVIIGQDWIFPVPAFFIILR